jgi:hypothetical protein
MQVIRLARPRKLLTSRCLLLQVYRRGKQSFKGIYLFKGVGKNTAQVWTRLVSVVGPHLESSVSL